MKSSAKLLSAVFPCLLAGFGIMFNEDLFSRSDNLSKPESYRYKIFRTADNTYGYDILINDKLTIHQPFIPSVSGARGFKIKTDAEKTARLIIRKLKKGESPPAVTLQELETLRISL